MSTFADELRAAYREKWEAPLSDYPGFALAEWAARFALERAARECDDLFMSLGPESSGGIQRIALAHVRERIRALAATLAAKEGI